MVESYHADICSFYVVRPAYDFLIPETARKSLEELSGEFYDDDLAASSGNNVVNDNKVVLENNVEENTSELKG